METEGVQAIGPEYSHLPYDLPKTELVQLVGRDGSPVSAHLTLPEGTVGAVPAVVVPLHAIVADP